MASKNSTSDHKADSSADRNDQGGGGGGGSIPPGINIENCPIWTDRPPAGGSGLSQTSLQFSLPVASDELFLLSRGPIGTVNVKQGGTGDVAQVVVTATYRHFEDLRRVQACAVNRGPGTKGVGLFKPDSDFNAPSADQHELSFSVSLHLPFPSKGPVLNVKKLDTDLPSFSHEVDDLVNGVHFGTFSLKTGAASITVKSLNAVKARSEAAGGSISGTFNVSSSLEVINSAAPIVVTANLLNAADGTGPTSVTLRTSSAPAKAQLSLVSAKGRGGAFSVDASTSSGPVDLTFNSAPIDSALKVNAKTSAGPAKVTVHPTYQGTFDLKTTGSLAKVDDGDQPSDPTGQGRPREVNIQGQGPNAWGNVTWSEAGLRLGSVNLETSASLATLVL